MRLYKQNQSLAAERDRSNAKLETANHRLENLLAERSTLQQNYVSLLNRARNQKSPLSQEDTRRLEELSKKYDGFDFDPLTGISKFHSDILFSSGSASIDPKSKKSSVLHKFSHIMNQGGAKRLNILVVGHTDDVPIGKRRTKSKHPTNWHLSTDRANSVVVMLSKFGIAEHRMGAAGYSMYQPVEPNKNNHARRHNRRVEIYVLAPDAVVAGWDPATSRN